MSKDLGYLAPVICGNVPADDLPTEPGEWQLRNVFDKDVVYQEMYYGCPLRPGHLCVVPILPKRNPNGSGWTWDGDMVNPSLSPSINCKSEKDGKPVGGCGWHGHLTQGRFQ